MQVSLVVTGPAVGPGICTFITLGVTKLISFGVEHIVEGLFNRAANHLTEMIFDPGLINFDNFIQVFYSFFRFHY